MKKIIYGRRWTDCRYLVIDSHLLEGYELRGDTSKFNGNVLSIFSTAA
jgi:hypothetical protein